MNKRPSTLEVFQIQQYLQEHKELFETLNGPQATDTLNEKFGTTVTSTTVGKYAAMLGIKLNLNGRGTPSISCAVRNRQIRTLALAIYELCEDMGSKQNPGIIKLLNDIAPTGKPLE